MMTGTSTCTSYDDLTRLNDVITNDHPASSAVLERDFSKAGRLVTGSRRSGAYAEIVLFLNGNQHHVPIEMSILSPEQALRAVPRRLSNLKAEMEAFSAGEARSTGEADVDATYDEHAGEAGKVDVDAGYGEYTGKGQD